MYVNQSGRSMVEMLGVLGIIGVLTVGGLSIVGKARRQQEITQTITEIAQLIESARKISCQYDGSTDGYGDYANFLKVSDEYPTQLEFTYKENDSKFTLPSDVEVKMPFAAGKRDANDEKVFPHFVVAISNMDEDTCMNIAAETWGTGGTNAYLGSTFNSATDYSDMSKNYPLMDLATATEKCDEDATLYLGFRACDCETCSKD